jgi:hypothetical protein
MCGSWEIDMVSGVVALLLSLSIAMGIQERSRMALPRYAGGGTKAPL